MTGDIYWRYLYTTYKLRWLSFEIVLLLVGNCQLVSSEVNKFMYVRSQIVEGNCNFFPT